MYEKPHLLSTKIAFRIIIIQQHATKLCDDLKKATFDALTLEDAIGFEDLNSDSGHEDVAMIEVALSTDKLALRKFLRQWTA